MKHDTKNSFLKLKRKEGQSITIDKKIVVKLLTSEDGQAELGVYAPKEMEVDRTEVANRKRSQS